MEEIHETGTGDNKYQFTVASGCQGTRTGLRGQPNRCTLKELCEHLWMQSSWEVAQLGEDGKPLKDSNNKIITVEKSDTRPDPDKTGWTANAKEPNGLLKLDVNKMMQAILNVMDPSINKKLAQKGYYGNLNVANAIKGATDYYATMADFGRNTWKFREEALKVESELTPAVKKRFTTWYDYADTAAKVVVDLRLKDKYKIEEDAIKNGLKKLFDGATEDGKEKQRAVRVVKVDAPTLVNPSEDDGSQAAKQRNQEAKKLIGVERLQMVSVVKTAEALSGPLGMSKEALQNKMTQTLQAGMASDIGNNHQAAIDGATRSQKLVSTGACA